MKHSKILNLNLPEDGDSADVADLNENFEALEAATYVIDRLAATYGYRLTTSTSDNVTTTTLIVSSSAPYTANARLSRQSVTAPPHTLSPLPSTMRRIL